MNYEKVILELMTRIQVLEEQMAELMKQSKSEAKKEGGKMTTEDIRNYIQTLKEYAKSEGKSVLVLRSGDIHKELELKNYMPPVCNAMRQCMKLGDIIIHTTPKGNSSTIEIEYKL
ncbi:MAG: hypothetical protein II319_08850 [Clostridia bacterium]|jgi:hypothetical protein|nr:hypothetical protein [Clostridia bacterium]